MNMVQIIVAILEQPQSVDEIVGIFGSENMTAEEIRKEVLDKVEFLEEKELVTVNSDVVTLRESVQRQIMAVENVKDVGPEILELLRD